MTVTTSNSSSTPPSSSDSPSPTSSNHSNQIKNSNINSKLKTKRKLSYIQSDLSPTQIQSSKDRTSPSNHHPHHQTTNHHHHLIQIDQSIQSNQLLCLSSSSSSSISNLNHLDHFDYTGKGKDKRKEQNRNAQRAFRERKEKRLQELQDQVDLLKSEREPILAENNRLKELICELQNENQSLNVYKQAFTFTISHDLSKSSMPLAEAFLKDPIPIKSNNNNNNNLLQQTPITPKTPTTTTTTIINNSSSNSKISNQNLIQNNHSNLNQFNRSSSSPPSSIITSSSPPNLPQLSLNLSTGSHPSIQSKSNQSSNNPNFNFTTTSIPLTCQNSPHFSNSSSNQDLIESTEPPINDPFKNITYRSTPDPSFSSYFGFRSHRHSNSLGSNVPSEENHPHSNQTLSRDLLSNSLSSNHQSNRSCTRDRSWSSVGLTTLPSQTHKDYLKTNNKSSLNNFNSHSSSDQPSSSIISCVDNNHLSTPKTNDHLISNHPSSSLPLIQSDFIPNKQQIINPTSSSSHNQNQNPLTFVSSSDNQLKNSIDQSNLSSFSTSNLFSDNSHLFDPLRSESNGLHLNNRTSWSNNDHIGNLQLNQQWNNNPLIPSRSLLANNHPPPSTKLQITSKNSIYPTDNRSLIDLFSSNQNLTNNSLLPQHDYGHWREPIKQHKPLINDSSMTNKDLIFKAKVEASETMCQLFNNGVISPKELDELCALLSTQANCDQKRKLMHDVVLLRPDWEPVQQEFVKAANLMCVEAQTSDQTASS